MVAEFEEIEGSHGLEHADLLVDQLEDLDHPPQTVDGAAHVVGVVVDPAADEDVTHQVQLEQDLLEPQLVGLVDDDEQHLVIAVLRRGETLWMLAVQDFIELDVVGIIEIGHGLSFGYGVQRLAV